jgi:phage host-nuclease inhibitor protein Gam
MAYRRYGTLRTVQDVEPVFEEMRDLNRQKEELKAVHGPVIAGLEKTLATAKKALKRALDRRTRRYAQLEAMVTRFALRKREHLLSLQRGKTVRVDEEGGTIKFADNPSHIEWEGKGDKEAEDAKIAELEEQGYERFVRVRKEIDVEALEREPEVAKQLGFRWEQDEKITIKP